MLRPASPAVATQHRTISPILHQRSVAWLVGGIILLSVLAKCLILQFGDYDLSFDEAYYWIWSRNLDWCYFSKGPGIALLIRATTAIAGDTEFGVRLGAILCSTGMLGLLYVIARQVLADASSTVLTVLMACAVPFLTGLGLLTTIDSPLLLCWTAAVCCLWNAVRTQRVTWWILLGFCIAVGTQFKFTMLLFLISVVLVLALEPAHRGFVRRSGPWLALVIVGASLVPIVLWNVQHDWITFSHTVQKASVQGTPSFWSLRYLLPSIGQQLGVASPVLAVGMCLAFFYLVRDARAAGKTPNRMAPTSARFLLATSSPVVVFYSLLAFHRTVEANWLAVAYVTLIPAAAFYWLRPFNRFQRVTLAMGLLVGFLFHVPLFLGDLCYRSPVVNWARSMPVSLPISFDITNRLKGWEEFGKAAQARLEDLERETGEPAFFISDHYSLAAWLGFYTKQPDKVFVTPNVHPQNQFHQWAKAGRQPALGASGYAVYDLSKGGRLIDPYFGSASPIFDHVPIHRGEVEIRTMLFRRGDDYLGESETMEASLSDQSSR